LLNVLNLPQVVKRALKVGASLAAMLAAKF